MAVETQRAQAPGASGQSVLRAALWTAAAALGASGALAAFVSALSGFLVYQYARARGQWGTDEPPAGVAEEVTFESEADSMRICGWFFAAADAVGAARPTVVLCHGVWTGRRECLPLALKFRAAGYNVLCFDFRAHGASDGRFTSVGFHETNDVLGAVHYLRSRAEVDPTRIAVIGFSMGAVATIRAAASCPDIAAVVADSAYASFVDAAKYSFSLVTRVPHFAVAGIAMRWAKWIVRVDAERLRPVLITHGVLDEIVPVQHAYTLFKAAEEPKEIWVVQGAHHVGARDSDPDAYYERVEEFLRGALAFEPTTAATTAQ
jgi:fermentation-respiration switch protein FrsA (DUF1100 family)